MTNEERTQQWMDRVDDYWYGLIPVIGEYTGFSQYSCESCGGLAGDRYQVTWTSMDREEDLEGNGEVCVSCAAYIANGDVPDEYYLIDTLSPFS